MTAEIAIMNREAVALAADSAVTVWTGAGKVYNTVQKLFTLSKYDPVGVLVCGRADIVTVPWETAVKMYREQLGPRSFATVEEHAQNFIAYLGSNDILFPSSAQADEFGIVVYTYLLRVVEDVDARVKKKLAEEGPISDGVVEEITAQVAKDHLEAWKQKPALRSIAADEAHQLSLTYASQIEAAIIQAFEKLPLSADTRAVLVELAGLIQTREESPVGTSGLVVAGFGHAQPFPALSEYEVYGVLRDRLIFAPRRKHVIGHARNAAVIVPIAQREMVSLFMDGLHPDYRQALTGFIRQIRQDLPNNVVAAIHEKVPDLNAEFRGYILQILQQAFDHVATELQDGVERVSRNRFAAPIIDTVSALPKHELAEMAEALINLASFRKRVSPDLETVGGPADVAVISKGDGFVWIKRKHYFRSDLNAGFHANYFRGAAHEADTQFRGVLPPVPAPATDGPVPRSDARSAGTDTRLARSGDDSDEAPPRRQPSRKRKRKR